jgi:Intracellular proteinase inhibitor
MRSRLLPVAAVLGLSVAGAVALVGCGDMGSGGADQPVLSVEQALAADPGDPLRVQGAVLATDTSTVLSSVLLESYPPQAGGAILPLSGLDLGSLVGLSSTAEEQGTAPVTWSDYWPVLEGVVENGAFAVKGTPRVLEAAGMDARVRFSPVSEPLRAGDTVWWAFDIASSGDAVQEVTFSSGRRADVALLQGGVEKYRWSEGKAFTEAIEKVMLEPGRSLSIVLNDTLVVSPGDYDLVAIVTGVVGPEGAATALPEFRTAVTVR